MTVRNWLHRPRPAPLATERERDHRVLIEKPVDNALQYWRMAAALAPDGEEVLTVVHSGSVVDSGSVLRVAAAPGSTPAATPVTTTGHVLWIRYSPDGRLVAARDLHGFGWWAPADAEPQIWTLNAMRDPSAVRFSADGQLIAVGAFDIVVARTEGDADVLATFSLPLPDGELSLSAFDDVAFSPESAQVLGILHEALMVCDLRTGDAEYRWPDALDRAVACVVSEDATTFAAGTADGRMVVADVARGQPFVDRTVSTGAVRPVAIDRAATVAAYFDLAAGTVTVRELDRWSVVTQIDVPGTVRELAFSADGNRLLVTEEQSTPPVAVLRLLDTRR